ncbi:N-acetyltransferase [Falsochrobactrum sp. TDYN1]|uniref:N-acetyltransferase n=1 Tax=Falsochrobactrum tianjinense TaxID=2706015 RepID=A0A949PSH6_9HYPH|nr:GNAT family N-acetyltransferase [Falsochrobactrum sp. TDYN1]MBV2144065.1 N-acetyltransferase [Falsochrobactrum sp. TDYN1]
MTGPIHIEKQDNSEGGRYTVTLGEDEAEMTYTRLESALISINHTFVPDSMRGKGIAQALAANAIKDARKSGWKIIPRCTFMQAQFKRHDDWSDVLENE